MERDFVNLRQDVETLRRDLSNHSARTKQQAIEEACKAAKELLTMQEQTQETKQAKHQQSQEHYERQHTTKLMDPEFTDQESLEKLMASEPIRKERPRRRDTEPGGIHCSLADVDSYGMKLKAAHGEAKLKVPDAARVSLPDLPRDRNVSFATAKRTSSRDGNSCMPGWSNSRDGNCVDAWMSLPSSSWRRQQEVLEVEL